MEVTMKKTIALALAVLLAVLATAAAAPAGSAADPLVSLNYINGTFRELLLSAGQSKYDGTLGAAYEQARRDLDAAYQTRLARLGALEGYEAHASPASYTLAIGQTARLLEGGVFTPLTGRATVYIEKGAVINVSTGQEVPSGSSLENGLRYLCAEDTMAVVTAGAEAEILFEGYVQTNALRTPQPLPFLDMGQGDWFYPAVSYAVGRELFKGTGEKTFSPNASMTRAMFVTVLYRMAGQPYVDTSAMSFSDVRDPSAYYYSAVAWASRNGVVTGYEDGSFRPDVSITREQMAAIMYRYADFAGFSVQIGSDERFYAFPDNGDVAAWAVSALKWATDRGIINGADGRILPANTATRAQVAQIIMNFERAAGI